MGPQHPAKGRKGRLQQLVGWFVAADRNLGVFDPFGHCPRIPFDFDKAKKRRLMQRESRRRNRK